MNRGRWPRTSAGVKLFGDVGWDPSGKWSPVRLDNLQYFHAFLPNQREAMAFTGKDDPVGRAVCAGGPRARGRGDTRRAGRHGRGLGNGRGGVGAVAAGLGLSTPPEPATALTRRSLWAASRAGRWRNRLRFANLCASLAVQEVGGSLAAPGWGDIADWWKRANARPERQSSQWLRRFSFLEEIIRDVPPQALAPGHRHDRPPLRRLKRLKSPEAGRARAATRITKVTYP